MAESGPEIASSSSHKLEKLTTQQELFMAGMFDNNIFTLVQKTLDFRTQRQDLLASNIANKDTPGYKAEDMVFQKSLEKALHAEEPGLLKTTNPRHFDGRNTPPLKLVEAQRINSASPFPDFDGNTVDLDREMAKMAENQLMYNASIRMLTHQFRMLKTAITEGR
ncbi:MAG: flagellar basal body rod protein FlgB [Proteobacteria bacterium]|nr:MAG: flagellar basal body rod protein FlgB [Pseudomonadota bacterium]